MLRNLDNCFYCQGLTKQLSVVSGKCGFCGVFNNPLYLVNYENKKRYFCCGCAWWQFPRSEEKKEAEDRWYQEWKKELAEQLIERNQQKIKKFLNIED